VYLTHLKPHARDWHGRVYTLTDPEVGANFTLLQHTATTVYATTSREGATQIYAARIPTGPGHVPSADQFG
jgi:hypothetical protein